MSTPALESGPFPRLSLLRLHLPTVPEALASLLRTVGVALVLLTFVLPPYPLREHGTHPAGGRFSARKQAGLCASRQPHPAFVALSRGRARRHRHLPSHR